MNEATDPLDVPAIRARLLAQMGEYAADYPYELERHFPRLLAQIAEFWGTPRLDEYLQSLMLPARDERQGFPLAVATDILRLTRISATNLGTTTGESGWAAVEEGARDKKAGAGK